jgi:cellulose synthase (UDP-forming)
LFSKRHSAAAGSPGHGDGLDRLTPRRVETEWVFRAWDVPIYAVLTVALLTVLYLFLRYWFSLRFDAVTLIATFVLLYLLSTQLFSWYLLAVMRRPRPMPAPPGLRVGVATTFVPGAESFEMLEETVEALVAMEYPHATWVLDEGDDEKVRQLCARLGGLHFTRKHLSQYHTEDGIFQTRSKVGNFNAWLHERGFDRYDVIVGFDPDHVPEPDYLHEVLGYFADPTIGYVQAAQVYYNQDASFIARGAAEETYAYYSTGQMASFAWGYPIVTGCHHAHRTSALREVGGLAPHDADDLLITIHYRAAGWRGVYLPKVLARGLTPVDWPGYLMQQHRWARSVLDIKLRQFPRLAHLLPVKERLLGFLHGAYYLQGLWILIALVLLCYLLLTGVQPEFISYETGGYLTVLFAINLTAQFFVQRFYLDWRREWGLHLRGRLLHAAKWPYFLWALIDVVLGRKRPYTLTAKTRTGESRRLMLWPHLVAAGAVVAAWLAGMAAGHDLHPLLHAGAAVSTALSLGLVWTESWSYPDPYQRGLHPRASARSSAVEAGEEAGGGAAGQTPRRGSLPPRSPRRRARRYW